MCYWLLAFYVAILKLVRIQNDLTNFTILFVLSASSIHRGTPAPVLFYINLFMVNCETSSTTYINHSRHLISDGNHRHEGMTE